MRTRQATPRSKRIVRRIVLSAFVLALSASASPLAEARAGPPGTGDPQRQRWPAFSHASFETLYQYDTSGAVALLEKAVNPPTRNWSLITSRGGLVGTRVTYPLSRKRIYGPDTPQNVATQIRRFAAPVATVIQRPGETGYTLVTDHDRILTEMRLEPILPLTVTAASVAIGGPALHSISATLWLHSDQSRSASFPITSLAVFLSRKALLHYLQGGADGSQFAFAMFPNFRVARNGARRCESTYTTERGDTFTALARRMGAETKSEVNALVAELIGLNPRLRRLRYQWLPAGLVLCMPTQARLAIETSYGDAEVDMLELDSTAPADALGKQVVLAMQPISPTNFIVNIVVTRTDTAENTPIIVGYRTPVEAGEAIANDFTVVTVGEGDLPAAFRPDDSLILSDECMQIGAIPSLSETLQMGGAGAVLWLEDDGGLRYPFYITRLLQVSAQAFRLCQDYKRNIAFAIYPAQVDHGSGYRAVVRFNPLDGQLGPIPLDFWLRCSGLRQSNHPFIKWLRRVRGCR